MRRAHVVVHGEVQGVFFRDTLRGAASEHGVAGWARNNSDGTVEAVFEGPEEAVDALVAVCREGTRAARVGEVEVSSEEPEGLEGFDVR
ncbi:MAG TPA: acylphosphatase [Thermoleophilaceae bacterium]|nr:acylphosphatase [Thermoleophilaceae bacterium]